LVAETKSIILRYIYTVGAECQLPALFYSRGLVNGLARLVWWDDRGAWQGRWFVDSATDIPVYN